ncbi:hypothetical protein [Sphaerisporangium album]|uniref:hypothetical protein n=1 Tax=Sphaerisporangium album TaxID=509200 RepID=UPI0015F07A37|nr:hypothetical protein [Sphaerisporangium album]
MPEQPPRHTATGETRVYWIPDLPNPDAPTVADLNRPDAVLLGTDRPLLTIMIDVGPFVRAADGVQRALAAAARTLFPGLLGKTSRWQHEIENGPQYARHRRRCRACNPAGNPRPLPINGHEYARRRRARARRRNR